MKIYILRLTAAAFIAITIYSCKLDKPIYPNTQIGKSTGTNTETGTTSVINNPDLTGTYYLLSDYSEDFDAQTDTPFASTKKYPALFKRVILTDSTKTAIVTFYPDSSVNFTYQLTSQNNKTYITLNHDIFPRSVNYQIEVTSLSSGSMQWMADDPATFPMGNTTVYTGYEVTFTKE
jgi:hypothetical protein